MNAETALTAPLDVLIVGAGISGIGMAAHLAQKCPQRSYAVIERREQLGGTWDLFRYPGIRSDSDMYTLGFDFEPWRHEKSIAEGDAILDYLGHVAESRGILPHIRFGQKATSANWDSAAALWRVTLEDCAGKQTQLAARFLFLGSGYYDYDNPHDAGIPGLADYKGELIHPQFWPEQFNHAGKSVVVIGSGATAVTLVPALAESAAHVTMLQRTPTWYGMRPLRDGIALALRRIMPEKWAYRLIRFKNIHLHNFLFKRARAHPQGVANFLQGKLREELGDHYRAEDFTPPYNPWEQRLCLVPEGDMFKAMKAGKASIVTGKIAKVDGRGISLEDGRRLDADVIVTATGLRLAVLGKIALSLDGKPVTISDHWYYRDCMFSDIPNFAALFGYLNAGWTLRVDIVADWLCRLFNQMDTWRMDVAVPVLPDDHALEVDPVFELFSSGYLQRGRHLIPKSATTPPWQISMDYLANRKEMRDTPIDDGVLRFERVNVPAGTV